MSMSEYDEVLALWQNTEGMGLSESDTRDAIAAYLKRNPGMSFVARDGKSLIAAVLCGHDGRRGYLHHLAVSPAYRRRGLGTQLVEKCLARLWGSNGWKKRPDICLVQKNLISSRHKRCC